MDGFVGDINYVGTEIELISLNGLIHAAHLGQDGAGLSVLADAIQKLSVDARVQIELIAYALKSIVDSTGDQRFANDSDEEMDRVKEVVQEMVDELGGFVQSLQKVTDNVKTTLTQMSEQALPYSEFIDEQIKRITVHELFDQHILEVIKLIQPVFRAIESYVAEIGKGDVKKHLEHLKQQYTMHSECNMHQSYVGEEPVFIEESIPIDVPKDQKFGDNIELF